MHIQNFLFISIYRPHKHSLRLSSGRCTFKMTLYRVYMELEVLSFLIWEIYLGDECVFVERIPDQYTVKILL